MRKTTLLIVAVAVLLLSVVVISAISISAPAGTGDLLYALLNPTGETTYTVHDFSFPPIPREEIWRYIVGQMPLGQGDSGMATMNDVKDDAIDRNREDAIDRDGASDKESTIENS